MYCRRCGNSNDELFKKTKKGYYCSNCQQFGKFYIDEYTTKDFQISDVEEVSYSLDYELTEEQKQCATKLVESIKNGKDVLVYAACGAGKTEMTMPLIAYCLSQKLKVGIAIPRKDVVIELCDRYQKAFPKIKVVSVYGEHHHEIDGDLLILTTHQLYRYENAFDVLIIDEVDAYPFNGNEILEHMVTFATRGQNVYLSATPSDKLLEQVNAGTIELVELFVRPHGGKLCVPKVKIGFMWYLAIELYKFLKRYKSKTILLFVPTKKLAKYISEFLNYFTTSTYVTSESENREVLNEQIKNHAYHIVVCTTVLERGITIPDVQVVVFDATNYIFSEASLIQISGRVGRKEYAKEGECLFLCTKKSRIVDKAVASIEMMNRGHVYE